MKRNLTGQKFGRLVALSYVEMSADNRPRWSFRCDCGTIKIITARSVIKGKTKSCGCLSSETTAARNKTNTKHGQHRSAEYRSWMHMLSRCYNPNMHAYAEYGGRGIQVCDRWRESFPAFLADMGHRPAGTSLDRYPDKNGNYELENCRWASQTEQSRNTRANRIVEFRGRDTPLSEAAALAGIADNVVRARLRWGWSVNDALTTPPRAYINRQIQR
jgi:hypothetical protein